MVENKKKLLGFPHWSQYYEIGWSVLSVVSVGGLFFETFFVLTHNKAAALCAGNDVITATG